MSLESGIHGEFKIMKAQVIKVDKDLKALERIIVTFHETRFSILDVKEQFHCTSANPMI